MDEGASDEELAKLMQELREAMDTYMRELAQRMMDDPQADDATPMPPDGQRMITQQDLQDMMDAMQEAMRNGDMAEAQRLMDEFAQHHAEPSDGPAQRECSPTRTHASSIASSTSWTH